MVNKRDAYGNTCLHYAARSNMASEVKDLCDFPGIDLLCLNNSDNSALHVAALNNNLAVVKILV